MRVKINYLTALIISITLINYGCRSDDPTPPTAQEEAFALLAGAWTLGNDGIQVDGQNVSLNYEGFTVSFTDGGYTTTNSGDLFKASGTWQWQNEQAGQINLDDGKEITIDQLTASLFRFSFNFSGTGGIANGIAGSYTITVQK